MSAAADALAAQLEAARKRWVALTEADAGPAVHIEAPSQHRAWRIADALRSNDGDAVLELLLPIAHDWRGITQADLQGPGVGSVDPAPFTPRLLRLAMLDRPQWLVALAMEAVLAAREARDRIKAASGN